MRKSMLLVLAALIVLGAAPAFAELQNVIVGGQVRIRGNYYMNTMTGIENSNLIWGAGLLGGRSIGTGVNFNIPGVLGLRGWDEDEHSLDFVEQRTRLNVKADFSNEVGAFIEMDAYDIWGGDFRSNYITGADFVTPTSDDVEMYQAYIEANEMWGLPLRLRIGRQELAFGSEWLLGVNDTSSFFTGLSFDAVRLTYATDMFSVDAFAAELAEGGPFEEDEDVWLYGVYGSYLGLEDIVIDAYWLMVRDGRRLADTNLGWFGEWIEDLFNVDDYDPTYMHTVGLRGAGTIGAFDFEAEVAYQFGDAHQVGFLFRPFAYGDDDAEYDAIGANLEVGYTFDMAWQPRIWLGGAYLDGEDNRDITFWEWLSPFDDPEASVSFNRLFSNWEYSEFLDINGALSNVWLVRGGIQAMPTESVELALVVTYFDTLEEFDAPAHITIGGVRIPIAGPFSFWTMENDSDLGIEAGLYATYHYSEDLTFEAGWAHLFTDDGATDGQYVLLNGLGFSGGTDDEDADYLYLETRVQF